MEELRGVFPGSEVVLMVQTLRWRRAPEAAEWHGPFVAVALRSGPFVLRREYEVS